MTDELIEIVGRAIEAADTLDRDKLARAAIAAINLPARLEAARAQGWNEAIEAAADAFKDEFYKGSLSGDDMDCAVSIVLDLTKDSTHDD